MRASIVRIETRNRLRSTKVGTGFLISKEGHVATNWHLVTFYSTDQSGLLQFEYADPIIVHWNDQEYEATVVHPVDSDRPCTYDFAILKIEATDVPCLPLGEYDDIKQGDQICFMGYPLARDEKYFGAGHVACLMSKPSHFNWMIKVKAIVLDASINKGNSGGPLVDRTSGKVVGIVTIRVGGISEKLKETRDRLETESSKWGTVESALQELIEHADRYTNIGIGEAISIEYLKNELKSLGIDMGG